jgi:hypothetical protein
MVFFFINMNTAYVGLKLFLEYYFILNTFSFYSFGIHSRATPGRPAGRGLHFTCIKKARIILNQL